VSASVFLLKDCYQAVNRTTGKVTIARTRRWHTHIYGFRSHLYLNRASSRIRKEPRVCPLMRIAVDPICISLSSCCQSRSYLPQSWAGSRWPSPSPSRLGAGKKPGRPRNLAGHHVWWNINAEAGWRTTMKRQSAGLSAPAEILQNRPVSSSPSSFRARLWATHAR